MSDEPNAALDVGEVGRHTPGPWIFVLEGNRWVLAANKETVAMSGRSRNSLANRALCESAPDLLAALRGLTKLSALARVVMRERRETVAEDGRPIRCAVEETLDIALDAARAAIAKAEGTAP